MRQSGQIPVLPALVAHRSYGDSLATQLSRHRSSDHNLRSVAAQAVGSLVVPGWAFGMSAVAPRGRSRLTTARVLASVNHCIASRAVDLLPSPTAASGLLQVYPLIGMTAKPGHHQELAGASASIAARPRVSDEAVSAGQTLAGPYSSS